MLCLCLTAFYVHATYVVVMNVYESVHSRWLRNKALEECLDHVRADDEATQGISIGPVRACDVCGETTFGVRGDQHT